MIEIYIFVNPLGGSCLKVEQKVLDFIAKSKKKIQFRFISLLNLQVVNQYIEEKKLPKEDIALRNHLFQSAYSASLDFKALQLQGKKIGRTYLLAIQRALDIEKRNYSIELVEEIIKDINADLEMFREDRQATFVKDSFRSDQQIAAEMGIQSFPSAVVFNYEYECDFGVLIENFSSIETLHQLYQEIDEKFDLETKKKNAKLNLHLI